MNKYFCFKCPNCGEKLEVDTEKKSLVSCGEQVPEEEMDFRSAVDAEKNRKQELEDLFKQAAKKAKDKPDNLDDFDRDKWR